MSWIDRDEALARLGVKPQTLYAYVSRGLVASRPAPHDSRASLYSTDDISGMLRRRRAGRRRAVIAAQAISWGDPVMETSVTTVRDGRLIYRGEDAVALSARRTLEQVAAHLWSVEPESAPPVVQAPPQGRTAKARGYAFLARRAALDAPGFGRSRMALAIEARQLMHGLCDAFVGTRSDGDFHERLGAYWSLGGRQTNEIRRALVVVADHELNPSTFAARVAASTGASLAACALAGYATLSGPLHGEAAARALAYLCACEETDPATVLARLAARGETPPATGHALYPEGDPRAAALLDGLRLGARLSRAIAAAEAATSSRSNIDMALAAMTVSFGLPDEAPFVLFAGGRMAGWMAHAIEQIESGRPIRPRASYVGP